MNLSKLIWKVLSHVKQIDVFGAPVTLNIDGKSSYQSVFGGLMSIAMMALVIALFEPSINDFINRRQVIVHSTELFSAQPVYLPLNDDNFMFFISIQQPGGYNFTEQPFFQIKLTQNLRQRINNTFTNKTSINIPLIPCKQRNFSQNISIAFMDIYETYGLDSYLCPKPGFQIELEGAYLSQDFRFAKIQIFDCSNENDTDWNYSCLAKEQMYEVLSQSDAFRFNFYSINYVINSDNTNQHTQIYLSEDLNFIFQPNISLQEQNVYFRQYNITTDYSLLTNKQYEYESLVTRDRSVTERQMIVDPKIFDQSSSYFTLYLRSDSISVLVTRQFQKFDTLLSNLGGFMNLFYTLFAVFLKYYNHEYFMLRLANKVYDFKENRENRLKFLADQRIAKLNNLLFRQREKHTNFKLRNSGTLMEIADNVDQIRSIGFTEKQELLDAYYEWFLKIHYRFIPGVKYFIYVLSCRRLQNTEHNKLVNEAVHQSERNMNIRSLMHEISTLKFKIKKISKLLLSQDERILLDYKPKPRLCLYDRYIKKKQNQTNQLKRELTTFDRRVNFTMRSSNRAVQQNKHHRAQMKFENLTSAFEKVYDQYKEDSQIWKLKALVDKEIFTILHTSLQLQQLARQQSPTNNDPFRLMDGEDQVYFKRADSLNANSQENIEIEPVAVPPHQCK